MNTTLKFQLLGVIVNRVGKAIFIVIRDNISRAAFLSYLHLKGHSLLGEIAYSKDWCRDGRRWVWDALWQEATNLQRLVGLVIRNESWHAGPSLAEAVNILAAQRIMVLENEHVWVSGSLSIENYTQKREHQKIQFSLSKVSNHPNNFKIRKN